MVCTICFLSWWNILAWSRWNFELVQLFLKVWLEIVLLRTHGVHCTFSFVMEILAWGRWNVEIVQLFLYSWIADCFVRHKQDCLFLCCCKQIFVACQICKKLEPGGGIADYFWKWRNLIESMFTNTKRLAYISHVWKRVPPPRHKGG